MPIECSKCSFKFQIKSNFKWPRVSSAPNEKPTINRSPVNNFCWKLKKKKPNKKATNEYKWKWKWKWINLHGKVSLSVSTIFYGLGHSLAMNHCYSFKIQRKNKSIKWQTHSWQNEMPQTKGKKKLFLFTQKVLLVFKRLKMVTLTSPCHFRLSVSHWK